MILLFLLLCLAVGFVVSMTVIGCLILVFLAALSGDDE